LALRKLKIPSSHPPAPARRDAPFTGFCSHSLRSSTYRTKYVSPKTLGAHQLTPVRIGDAHYSSRRGPRSGRPWNEASRRFGVGWVKKGGLLTFLQDRHNRYSSILPIFVQRSCS